MSDMDKDCRGGRSRRRPRATAGEKGATPRVLPAPARVQVLRREDRLHQLQGREAAGAVHSRARQDSAAADFRRVRDASARAADGDQARAPDRARAVRHRLRPAPSAQGSSTRSQVGVVMSIEVILKEHVENLGNRGEVVQGRQRVRAQLPVAAQARAGGHRREQAPDRTRAREGRGARGRRAARGAGARGHGSRRSRSRSPAAWARTRRCTAR